MTLLAAAAIACAAAAFAPAQPLRFDLAVRGTNGHALLKLGFASIRIAFDFGQQCSESDGCSGGGR